MLFPEVMRFRVDTGLAAGTTTSDAARIKALEREANEHKRANEIHLAATSFFAWEFDQRLSWYLPSSTITARGSASTLASSPPKMAGNIAL